MKRSAELLGVSYGTLYGRYRDTFGYLKSGWSQGHKAAASKTSPQLLSLPAFNGGDEATAAVAKLVSGFAAAGMGLDSAMLAYQMALKASGRLDEEPELRERDEPVEEKPLTVMGDTPSPSSSAQVPTNNKEGKTID